MSITDSAAPRKGAQHPSHHAPHTNGHAAHFNGTFAAASNGLRDYDPDDFLTLVACAQHPAETYKVFTESNPAPFDGQLYHEDCKVVFLAFAGACSHGRPERERVEAQLETLLFESQYDAARCRYLLQALYSEPAAAHAPAEMFEALRIRHESTLKPLADEVVPPPALKDDKGRAEFSGNQLADLLHPTWGVESLTSHAAHAARIAEHMGEEITFCPSLGWLYWNGRHWEIDDRGNSAVAARVAGIAHTLRGEAARLFSYAGILAAAGRGEHAEAMGRAAAQTQRATKQAETRAFIDSALHLASGSMRANVAQFDQKPWRMGFANGTWDAGQWRDHRREDYALHLSPVAIHVMKSGEWETVLERMTGGDVDFARTLQDIAGYVLSGASHLRVLPWLYGPKGTGKSTFAELLQAVLGTMSATIDPKKLQDDAARERLGADLWNKRLAVCGEAGSQRLEAELLKTLSGSDSLPVRFLYKEAFTVPPRHVLMMVANDPPRVDAYDEALRDRVIALPFTHPLAQPNPLQLTGGARIEAVRREPDSPLVRGFASWAVAGLARLHKTQEIYRAACVESATQQFWADTDPLTPFWETVSPDELRAGIAKNDLRRRYESWCEVEGARTMAARQWTRACVSHGLTDKKSGGVRLWIK